MDHTNTFNINLANCDDYLGVKDIISNISVLNIKCSFKKKLNYFKNLIFVTVNPTGDIIIF